MKWRVCWRDLDGSVVRGGLTTREVAQSHAEWGRRRYPGMTHWLEGAEYEDPRANGVARRPAPEAAEALLKCAQIRKLVSERARDIDTVARVDTMLAHIEDVLRDTVWLEDTTWETDR